MASGYKMETKTDWRVLRWNYVKSIASKDFTRVVGLIPIAGYLILFNDEIVSMASFNTLAGVAFGERSPFLVDGLTKLRFVFFGSLFVLASFAIYRVFRPDVLEFSNSDLEFAELVRQRYSVHDIVKMDEQVHSGDWIERTDSFWIVQGKLRRKETVVSGYRWDARAHMLSKRGDYISLLAREWWLGQVHKARFARIFSLVLGFAGYLFLAIPSLDVAQAVLRNLFSL